MEETDEFYTDFENLQNMLKEINLLSNIIHAEEGE